MTWDPFKDEGATLIEDAPEWDPFRDEGAKLLDADPAKVIDVDPSALKERKGYGEPEKVSVADWLEKNHSVKFEDGIRDYEGKAKAFGLSGNAKTDFETLKHRESTLAARKKSSLGYVPGGTGMSGFNSANFRADLKASKYYFSNAAKSAPASVFKAAADAAAGAVDLGAGVFDFAAAADPGYSGRDFREMTEPVSAFIREMADMAPEIAGVDRNFSGYYPLTSAVIEGAGTVAVGRISGGASIYGQMFTESIRDSEAERGKKFAEFTDAEKDAAYFKGTVYSLAFGKLEKMGLRGMFPKAFKSKAVLPKSRIVQMLRAGAIESGTEVGQNVGLNILGALIEGDRELLTAQRVKDLALDAFVGFVVGGGANVSSQASTAAVQRLDSKGEIERTIDRQMPYREDGSFNPAYKPMPLFKADGSWNMPMVDAARELEKARKEEEALGEADGEQAEAVRERVAKAEQVYKGLLDEADNRDMGEAAWNIRRYNAKLAVGLNPMEGATATDWAFVNEYYSDEEVGSHVVQMTGDEGLVPVALAAKHGDTEAQAEYVERTLVPADSEILVEAEITPEEAEAMRAVEASQSEDFYRKLYPELFEAESPQAVRAEAMRDMIDFVGSRQLEGSTIVQADEVRSFEQDLNDLRDQGVPELEIERFAFNRVQAAGLDPMDPLNAPSNLAVYGRNEADFRRGVWRDVSKLFKGADPMTVVEETSEGFLKRMIAEGELTYQDVAAWRETMGDKGGETEAELIEWVSEQSKAWMVGKSSLLEREQQMPSTFRRFLSQMFENFRHLFRRAAQLKGMDRRGELDAQFKDFLERSNGLDENFLRDRLERPAQTESISDIEIELLEVVPLSRLPRPDMEPEYRGELEQIFEAFGKNWKSYPKDKTTLDGVMLALQEEGFNVQTPADVIDAYMAVSRGERVVNATNFTDSASYSMGPMPIDFSKVLEDALGYEGLTQEQPSISVAEKQQMLFDFSEAVSNQAEGELTSGRGNNSGRPGSLRIAAQKFQEGLARDYKVDFLGAEIRDDADLALHAQSLRNPLFETFYYFAVKDGKLVDVSAISGRIPFAANVVPDGNGIDWVSDKIKNWKDQGISQVYLLHNHPSGDTYPSPADVKVTGAIAERVEAGGVDFGGHIIINHKEFRVLDGANVGVKKMLSFNPGADPILQAEDAQPFPGVLNKRIDGPERVVDFAKQLEANLETRNDEMMTVFIVGRKNDVRGAFHVSEQELLDPSNASEFKEMVRSQGGAMFAIYGETSRGQVREKLNRYKDFLANAKAIDVVIQAKDSAVFESGNSMGMHRDPGISYFMGEKYAGLEIQEPGATYSLGRISETPAFKNWFGDSKVVDENGEPLVVYHGTNADFEAFAKEQIGKQTARPIFGLEKDGFYFAKDPSIASRYSKTKGGNIVPVYVRVVNPAISIEQMVDNPSFDGFINDKIVVVRDPTQIKSATGNRGTFDPNDPRITYSMGRISELGGDPEQMNTARERTPEERLLAQKLREFRETDTPSQKLKDELKTLQVKAVESRKRQRLQQSAERKIAAVEARRLEQIKTLHDQGEDVTAKLEELDRIKKGLPTAVRHRLGGEVQVSRRKTRMGRQNEVNRRLVRARELAEGHEATRRKAWLRRTLKRYGTQSGPKLQNLSKEVTKDIRDRLRVALYTAHQDRPEETLERMARPEGMDQQTFEDTARDFVGLLQPHNRDYGRIEAAYFAVQDLIREGKYSMDQFRDQRKARLDELAKTSTKQALQGNPLLNDSEIAQQEEASGAKGKAGRWLSNAMSGYVDGFENIIRRIDGEQEGPIWRELYADRVDGIAASQDRVNIYVADAADMLLDGLATAFPDLVTKKGEPDVSAITKRLTEWERHPKKGELTGIEMSDREGGEVVDRPLSIAEAITVKLLLRQKGSHPTFVIQHGVQDIAAFEKTVDTYIGADGLAFVEHVISPFYDGAFNQLNEVHKRVEGYELDPVKDYFPFLREIASENVEDAGNPFAPFSESGAPDGVEKGSLKTRSEMVTLPFRFQSVTTVLQNSVRTNANYIGKAGLEKKFRRLTTDPNFKRALKQRFGAKAIKQFVDAANVFTAGRMQQSGWGGWLDAARSRMITGVLAAKPKIMFTQLTSIPAGAVDMPVTEWVSGVAQIMRSPEKHFRELLATPQMKHRITQAQAQETITSLNKLQSLGLGAGWGARMEQAIKYSMILIKVGDVAGASLSAGPVYFRTKERELKAGKSEAEAKQIASHEFAMAVNRSQQSPHLHSRPQTYQKSEFLRALYAFRSAPIQYQSEVNRAISEFVRISLDGAQSSAKRWEVAKQSGKAFFVYHILLPQLFYALNNALIGFWLDDEDRVLDYRKGAGLTLLFGNFSAIPVAGDVIYSTVAGLTGTSSFSPTVAPIGAEQIARIPGWMDHLISGTSEQRVKAASRMANFTGLPVETIVKQAQSFSELMDDDDPTEFLEMMGWSEFIFGNQ